MHQGCFETVALPPLARLFLFGQAAYFFVTGMWPIVSPRTFQRVTGPKVDMWVVKTLGLTLGLLGLELFWAGKNRRVAPEIARMGAGMAAALGAVDVWYVARQRIAPIYLLDALAEAVTLGAWTWMRAYVRKQ